jgi:aspartyl-tRNA(Asn)/glutamyl-tRNA(Gln) amidotransferase subunit A
MTRRIRDTALALDVVVGPDPTDLRSLPAPNEPWSPHLRDPRSPTRVGWSPTLGYAAVDREIVAVCEQAVRQLEGLGIEVVDVDEVWPTDPIEVWYLIASAHNLRALGEYRGQDVWDDFDPMLQTSIEWADHTISATDYLRAEDQIHRLHLRLAEVLADVDVLLGPTTAGQTPVAGDSGTIDGEHDLNWVKMTYPFNLTRSPAGSVCAGFTADGLPVGLQVVGAQHDDLGVLRALAVFEDALAIDAVAPFGVA